MFGKSKIGRIDYTVCKLAAAVEAGLSSRENWQTLTNGLSVRAKPVGQMFLVSIFPAGWPKDSYLACYIDVTGLPLSAVTVRIPRLNLDARYGFRDEGGVFILCGEVVGIED